MNEPVLKGMVMVANREIPDIEGGFGKNKKCILVKHIAGIHGKTVKRVNEIIARNQHRFRENVDLIDAKECKDLPVVFIDRKILTTREVTHSKRLYLLSQRGYAKLIKLFDDDKSWDLFDLLLDEYFELKSQTVQPQKSPSESLLEMSEGFVEMAKQLIEHEKQMKQQKTRVGAMSSYLVKKPSRSMLNQKVIELSRMQGKRNVQLAWNTVYGIFKDKYGIDIPERVQRRQEKIQAERLSQTRYGYAQSTLDRKVNGLDIVFELEKESELMNIVIGCIGQEG